MEVQEFKDWATPTFRAIQDTPDACVLFFQKAESEIKPNGNLQATIDIDGALALILLMVKQFRLNEMPVPELLARGNLVMESMEMDAMDESWTDVIEMFNGGQDG